MHACLTPSRSATLDAVSESALRAVSVASGLHILKNIGGRQLLLLLQAQAEQELSAADKRWQAAKQELLQAHLPEP